MGGIRVSCVVAALLLGLKHFSIAADEPGPIVVEGRVLFTDDAPIPFVSVSNSLDSTVAHSDVEGRYRLQIGAAGDPTNLPFVLFLSKPAYRPIVTLVSNAFSSRIDYMTLLGQTNNDFTNRYFIPSANYSGANNNRECTLEPGEQGPGDKSVWYSYTAPADGTIRVIAQAYGMRPALSFFTGTDLPTLKMREPTLASNYFEARTYLSADVTVHAGEPLQIRIAAMPHWISFGGNFTWSLSFSSNYPLFAVPVGKLAGTIAINPPPNAPNNRYLPGTMVELTASTNYGYSFAGWSGGATGVGTRITVPMDEMKWVNGNFGLVNDHLTNALVLEGVPAFTLGLNAYGSKEPGEPNHCGVYGGNSVWWRWTAPSNMSVELDFEFIRFSALIGVYTGDSVSNLTLVANNQNVRNKRIVRFDVLADTTYYIAVDGFAGEQSFDFSFIITNVPEARYWLAWEVEGNGTVWLDPTPDGGGEYAAGTSVSVWPVPIGPTRFDAWTGFPSAQAVPLGTNVPLIVTMDRDHRIRASFVSLDQPPPRRPRQSRRPPNDNFANRNVLFQIPTYVFGVNKRATRERGEPYHAGGDGKRSMWWTWTAQRTGPVDIRFQWAYFDAALAIYTGEQLTNLVPVASTRFGPMRDTQTVLEFPAEAGTTYQIVVAQYARQTNSTLDFSFVLWPQ